MNEQIFKNEYKEVMKIRAIFAFLTSISIEKYIRESTNIKISFFHGLGGQVAFFKNFAVVWGCAGSVYTDPAHTPFQISFENQ